MKKKAFISVLSLSLALPIAFLLLLSTLCLLLTSCTASETDPNDTYTQKIHQKLANGESFLLGDIFEFEFDEAYVIPELYSTGDSLLKKYHLSSSIELKDIIYYETTRILFLKDGCVVFDYGYSLAEEYKIFTPQADLIIFPDTELTPLNYDNGVQRFTFEGHVVNGIFDREYNEKISAMIALGKDEFVLNEIFDFDFDRAFVVSENDENYKYLNAKLDLKTSVVYMKHNFDNNIYDRIIFIKEDTVVFDYLCSNNTIFYEYKGTFVLPDEAIPLFPDTELRPLNDNNGVQRFTFEGHVVNGILDSEDNEKNISDDCAR